MQRRGLTGLRTNSGRRVSALLIALVLLVFLSACSPGGGSTGKTGGASGSAAKAPATSQAPNLPKGSGDAAILKVSGAGIAYPADLSLSQLQAMKDGSVKETFSARNSWPMAKSFTAQGVRLSALLKTLGIKKDAGVITITGSDGYLARFTPDQLLKPRQSYPQLASGSAAGATPVDALLSWSWTESPDTNPTTKLRNFVGQDSLTDVNTVVSVKDVVSITVSDKALESWDVPQYDVAKSGEARTVTLYHPSMDNVQVYYTLDGSEPTPASQLYNPSTSYYQPQLIVPIKAQAGMTLKMKVVGYGKEPSKVETVAL